MSLVTVVKCEELTRSMPVILLSAMLSMCIKSVWLSVKFAYKILSNVTTVLL